MEHIPVGGSGVKSQFFEKPWRGGTVYVSIPGGPLIPKKHAGKGLQLDRVRLGNANDPGGQQFVLKRLGMGWPHLAVGHLNLSVPCDALREASIQDHPKYACR